MFTQKQYVVRKRRSDLEQLSYSEFYDEFIGMTPTGRIVDSKGNIIALDMERISTPQKDVSISIEEDESITTNLTETIKTPMVESSRVLIVEHQCGSSLVDCEFNVSEIDFEEYKKDIETKFWEGFVISINYLGD